MSSRSPFINYSRIQLFLSTIIILPRRNRQENSVIQPERSRFRRPETSFPEAVALFPPSFYACLLLAKWPKQPPLYRFGEDTHKMAARISCKGEKHKDGEENGRDIKRRVGGRGGRELVTRQGQRSRGSRGVVVITSV